jgi:HAD superfamily hydrolase (TIGR01509 family)
MSLPHATRTYDLVVFDCDGVLVDSEMLSAAVLMAMMEEEGLPITVEIFRSDFLGRSFASAAKRASQRFGKPLAEDFQQRYRQRLLAKMQTDLKPMAGVEQVLSELTLPHCLATSSSPQRLAISLSTTGLSRFFDGVCTTASEVVNGKPAPDIFLHAAAKMGVAPERCLVLEDSEMGIRAAKAAGMAVWHFRGGAHIKAGYVLPPDLAVDGSVDSMVALVQVFRDAGICRP